MKEICIKMKDNIKVPQRVYSSHVHQSKEDLSLLFPHSLLGFLELFRHVHQSKEDLSLLFPHSLLGFLELFGSQDHPRRSAEKPCHGKVLLLAV